MNPIKRAAGILSRRLDRPELLAAVDGTVLQAQREAIGISAILATSLTPNSIYVDAGANRGQVLRDAVRIAPRARHIAFEPIPALAAQVRRDFPDVDCRQLALGAQAEVTQFCHFTTLDGWSGLRRNPQISDQRGHPQYIEVEVSTLDAQLASVAPKLIKIDVEGAELAVLEGGREILGNARPVVIFEHVADAAVVYGATPGAPFDLLSELDYELFAVTGDGPLTRDAFLAAKGIVNWLAVPLERSSA